MGIPWYEVGTASLERTGVSFFDLGDKQVPVAHPSIAGADLSDHLKQQLLYPHRRQISLAHEKPREPLLGPDELVVKESVRRRLNMHKKWAMMMFWGFCDGLGMEYPIWTEEEYLRMQKGMPPRPSVRKNESEDSSKNGQGVKPGAERDAKFQEGATTAKTSVATISAL